MQLEDFFKTSANPYYNESDCELEYDGENGSVLVSGPPPQDYEFEENIIINLVSNHASINDFIFEFLITDVSDIETITPELLLKRFFVGRGWLYCYIDPEFKNFLSFIRNDDVLSATDAQGNTHEVPPQVLTVDEIVIYTKHFFQSKN